MCLQVEHGFERHAIPAAVLTSTAYQTNQQPPTVTLQDVQEVGDKPLQQSLCRVVVDIAAHNWRPCPQVHCLIEHCLLRYISRAQTLAVLERAGWPGAIVSIGEQHACWAFWLVQVLDLLQQALLVTKLSIKIGA